MIDDFSDLACTPKATKENCIAVLKANRVPFIQGSPGISKSDIVKEIANEFGLKLIDLRLSQMEPCDLLGFPFEVGDRADYKPMKTFPLETDNVPENYNGWLLFFDEFNSANREVQAASYRIILDREIGNKRIHPACFMVCAGNKSSDKAIVNKLSSALQSRLVHLFMQPNTDDWIEWAITHNIDARIIAYLSSKPGNISTFNPDSTDVTYACPRTWHMLSDIIKETPELKGKHPLIAGVVGKGVAVEFTAFCDLGTDLPSIADIIANPQRTKIPDKLNAMYYLISSIATNLDKTNCIPLLEYCDRIIRKEMLVLLFRIASNGPHGKELLDESEFTTRAIKFVKDFGA